MPNDESSPIVLVAGASGVIGRRFLPELVAHGYSVLGLTRSRSNAQVIERLGATALVCDVYDAPALGAAFENYAPGIVVDLLTDLPDEADRIPRFADANNRMRTIGTDNLLGAAERAGAERVIAESVAWELPGNGALAVEHLENAVLSARGVVLRYGQLWGEGTYHLVRPSAGPTLSVVEAGRLTMQFLGAEPGIYELVDQPFRP